MRSVRKGRLNTFFDIVFLYYSDYYVSGFHQWMVGQELLIRLGQTVMIIVILVQNETCFNDRCSLCVITPLAPALAVLKATLEGPIIILIIDVSQKLVLHSI